jgi:hypothetical protein
MWTCGAVSGSVCKVAFKQTHYRVDRVFRILALDLELKLFAAGGGKRHQIERMLGIDPLAALAERHRGGERLRDPSEDCKRPKVQPLGEADRHGRTADGHI